MPMDLNRDEVRTLTGQLMKTYFLLLKPCWCWFTPGLWHVLLHHLLHSFHSSNLRILNIAIERFWFVCCFSCTIHILYSIYVFSKQIWFYLSTETSVRLRNIYLLLCICQTCFLFGRSDFLCEIFQKTLFFFSAVRTVDTSTVQDSSYHRQASCAVLLQ